MRWIFLVLVIGVTAGGWAFGFVQMQRADDIESKLTTAQTDLLQLEKLQAAQEMYGNYQDAIANFEEVTKQLYARRTELASLNVSVTDVRTELERLRGEAKEYQEVLAEAPKRYITTTGAKMRAGSGTTTAELAVVRPGVALLVFKEGENRSWHKVSLTGYMYHELLKPDP